MWQFAMLVAAIFAIGGGLLELVSSESRSSDISRFVPAAIGAVITFVVLLPVNWLMMYSNTPVFAGAGLYIVVGLNLLLALVIFGVVDWNTDRYSAAPFVSLAGIVVLVIGLMWNAFPLRGASDTYGHQLKVEMAKIGAYPPTSDQNMVTVSDQNALNKANQVMGQNIPGSNNTLGSRYGLGQCDLQSVDAHMYYICNLVLSGTVNNRADKYTVPGYVVVDAQDPNAAPQAKLGYHMVYTVSAPFSHSLSRHVYNNGYRGYYIDDITLEVDDQWRPFYTASIDSPPVRLRQSVPVGFITVDPQTGAIARYALNRIPAWVDRVYSAAMAENMLNWWGEWGAVPWNVQGSGGRYKVDGNVTLVYTNDGPAWQALMTSLNSDTSVSYIALMDTRDKVVRMYKAPAGLTIQTTVVHAINSSSSNLKGLDPVNMALHEIYGELVWLAPLVPNGTAGKGAEPSAGLALLNATDPNSSDVIIGQDKADALQQLSAQIASGSNNNAPGATSRVNTASGTISAVDQFVTNGHTYVVMMLKGDTTHLYRGEVTGNDIRNLEMALAKVGDSVTLTYVDTGSPILNVSSYTDNSLTKK